MLDDSPINQRPDRPLFGYSLPVLDDRIHEFRLVRHCRDVVNPENNIKILIQYTWQCPWIIKQQS